MTTAEERLKILKMIQDGRITAEEGAKLLKALTTSSQKPRRQVTARTSVGAARWLRVRVTDMSSGKSKVNVNLPLKLVDAGLNIAAQFAPEDIDVGGLMEAVNEAIDDVDGEDGEHIEVFIE